MRFIHTADWQIGMRAAHVGAAAEAVRAERLKSARRTIDVANDRTVDFLVVAGDVFEHNAVDRVWVQKVVDTLALFRGPVYIIPGNHDPLVPGSVWDHRAWQSAANLHVLTECLPVQIDGGTLYPCPLREKHSLKDPTRWIDARQAQGIAIGIAHGTVEGVSSDELDYPIARDAAARAGLDYLALGHWHSTATFAEAGRAIHMAYSGSHETTRFGERESGNVLLVEIDRRGSPPTLTPMRTGGLRWESPQVEVREAGDLVRVREMIEAMPEAQATLLDIRIRGLMGPETHAELTRLDEIIRARFLYGQVDASELLLAPDDDRWLTELPPGVLREVAKRLQELSHPGLTTDRPDGARPEVARRALLELYRMSKEADS